jgi:hypothetical protein
MLRRLFQTQFENFWTKYTPDQQMALKKELLARITQIDDDETIRKKICYIAAELAKNLMGIYHFILSLTVKFSIFFKIKMKMINHNGRKLWNFFFNLLIHHIVH